MAEVELSIPLKEEEVRNLNLGDIVYLNGIIYTARDEAHIHALEYLEKGKEVPVEFKNSAVFHCGPVMRKTGDKWELVAAGPTTSSRMNTLEPGFIEKFKVKAIIGKGGMSKPTIEANQKYGCVYLSITGGVAVLAAIGVKEVIDVHWFELGMPEAVWVFDARHFGPLIVAIDTKGNSLYEAVEKEVESNIPGMRKKLGLD